MELRKKLEREFQSLKGTSFPAPQQLPKTAPGIGLGQQPPLAGIGAGEKNSRSQLFQLGEGLDGGGSRGEDGREREVEPGEKAVLNSSHLINLHR